MESLVDSPVENIGLPSLHIKGAQDWMLTDSNTLEEMYEESKRCSFTHNAGHEIPLGLTRQQPEIRTLLEEFFEGRRQAKMKLNKS